MTRGKYDARTKARMLAVQALYQMDIAKTPLETIIVEFARHRFTSPIDPASDETNDEAVDVAYFEFILRGVVEHQTDIDRQIDDKLSSAWRLHRLDSTLRAILRCGVQELLHGEGVPNRAIVSQYSDLAHAFFDGPEGGMANALLDGIAKQQAENG